MTGEGFVGFFDILGYQDVIDNNEINKVSDIISKILISLPTKAADKLVSLVKDDEIKAAHKADSSLMETRLISDSILLAMPIGNDDDNITAARKGFFFLAYVAQLMRLAFDSGLPLRGAIDKGGFFLTGQCFAGKPIINCYRIGQRMQLAGCAITKECIDYSRKVAKDSFYEKAIEFLMFSHLVPVKNGEPEKHFLVDWYLPFNDWGVKHDNLRVCILDAFHSHNKDIPPSVMDKVNNTEVMLHRSLKHD